MSPACAMIIVSLIVIVPAPAFAAETLVWRIGAFDYSSSEFRSQSIDYSDPKQSPTYRVGHSKDSEDWWRFQPGPANGMTGGREHPFNVLFDLKQPRGVYRLTVAVLYETPRLSYLKLNLNGHTGNFYFHPRLDYRAGDWEGTFVPQTSWDKKTIDLPAQWFREGENRLVFTALDDPPQVETSLGSIAPGHTGLVYDALELDQDPDARYDESKIEPLVVPTIFYHQSENGLKENALKEVVEVYASFAHMPSSGEAELSVAGTPVRANFASTGEFGEQPIEFQIPEWTGTIHAELKIHLEPKIHAEPNIGDSSNVRSFPVDLIAARKWTLYIVPHEHLDIGFTDYPEKVAELHAESIDGVLELQKKVPDFRWTLDGEWVAEKYLEGRSAEKREQFVRAMREGKIVLPPQFANQHTGTASLEGLFRSLYDAHALAAKNNFATGAAHITDVPSYSWSYASVLADAGVKYFVAASNSWRAPIQLLGRWNEKSPFYWQGPDGGKVLMWYSRAYLQLATMFGTPPRLAAVRDSLPVFLQAYSRPGYKASAAIIFGTQLENTALSKEHAYLPSEWNKLYAWPKLEFSTFADAMAAIEKPFNGQIQTYRGDFGPYWEDGFGSDSFATAVHRQNQQRILSAEKLGTLPAVLNAGLLPERNLLQAAWHNTLLFDEHTWTYVGATTQPDAEQTKRQLELKRSRTTSAQREISEAVHRSWAQLESFLGPQEPSIAVFNSLSWARTGTVEIDLQDGSAIFDGVTGNQLPVETLFTGRGTSLPGFGGGYRRVRFVAPDVPGIGYKLFAIRPTKSPEKSGTNDATHAAAAKRLTGTTFENNFYRITIDPESGALRSIWDKDLSRELVDSNSPYRFGSYIYVTGADDIPNNSLYRFGAALKPPRLTPTPASGGHLVEAVETANAIRIVLESSAPHTSSIRTEITLPKWQKRIDLTYSLHKDHVLTKEAVYIAFPFAMSNPKFAYETQNAWVDPARDELSGGSREWYAVNHWAAVRDGDGNSTAAIIPYDAPLVNFGDIVRGNWPTEFAPKSSTIFSWLMNNYWGTNFAPGQGGDFTFHYSIVSNRTFDPATVTRAGWENMTPLESDPVNASFESGTLPSNQSALLSVDNPDVAVVTWKIAEDGRGTILRLEELAGKAAKAKLTSQYFDVREAWRCSGLENDQTRLASTASGVEIDIKPFEIVTLRLITGPRSHSADNTGKIAH
jgi:alpha-mannosidase